MDNSEKELIVQTVEIEFTVDCAGFAVLAFLLYDTVLLFKNEVKYFWQQPKNSLRYLYYATRYSGILSVILDLICNTAYFWSMLDVMSILLIDYILLLRVRALYSRGRVITIVLAIAFAIEVISGVALGIQGVVAEKPQPFAIAPGITYCLALATGLAEDVASWCSPLVYGILLMTLAVYKSAIILKEDPGLSTTTIIKIFVRDQVVYFMALIWISVGAIIFDLLPSSIPVLVVSNSLGSPAILSSVGARLLLNMKEAGAKGLNEGMGSNISKATVSGMDFAEAPAQASVVSGGADERGVNEEIEMVEV